MRKPHTVVINKNTITFRDKKNKTICLVDNERVQKALRYKNKHIKFNEVILKVKDL